MTVITSSPTQFGKLLDLQKTIAAAANQQTLIQDASGMTLKTIKEINQEQLSGQKGLIEGMKDDTFKRVQQEVSEEQLEVAKKTNDSMQKMREDLKKKAIEDAKIIATIAGDMRLFKSVNEKLTDKIKDSIGSLSNTLDTFGIVKKNSGSIISNFVAKREEKINYIKDQKSLGSTLSDKELAANFSKAQKAAKEIDKNESAISRFKKMGLNEAQIAKTGEGKALLDKRVGLSNEYAKYDLKTKLMNQDDNNTSEKEIEAQKSNEETKNLLEKIANNTTPNSAAAKGIVPEKTEGKDGGGFLDGIMGFFSAGFMKALKAIFNPANILKSLGKVFGITMIIGSLINGIMDGFEEFAKSGELGKAIIAGLGGVLSFLTFGLVNKDDVQKIVESVSEFVQKNIVEPLGAFFKNMKDGILSMLSNIGIPEIKFKIPVINKDVSIGPYYPFKDAAKPNAVPQAPEPTAATQVEAKSAENAEAAAKSTGGDNNTAIVAPTVNNVTKQNQIIKSPIRNQESTIGKYVNSRYA